MIAGIHQPQYLPWLGYMNKIASSDVFVFLDTVQYRKNEWQNRNRIKTAQGWQWLTVPVCYRYPERISEVRIDNATPWGEKHWKTLVTNYSRAPYFDAYADFFHDTYTREWELLADLNIHIIRFLMGVCGLKTRTIRASELDVDNTDPTGRLVAICRAVKTDTYLSGRDGARYMDADQFHDNAIRVCYQDCAPVEYPQLFGGFIPNLSGIDLLFNCGPSATGIIENQFVVSEHIKERDYEGIGNRCPSR
ncbi:MAG: WbqC family protein [bacterium]